MIRCRPLLDLTPTHLPQDDEAPEPPKENVMINSLIHEYLEFNGLVGTSRLLALGQ